MNPIDITVKPRFLGGSSVANKVRRAGLVPGVVYGAGTENTMVALEPKALTKALNSSFGLNQLINLKIQGREGELLTICRDVQVHPVRRTIRHVDFFSITPDQKIQVKLPIRLTGRSAGQKIGGRLLFVRRFVTVECTAKTMPDAITMALEPFNLGDIVGVEDLPFPEGVKPVYRKAFKIFEIKAARAAKKTDEEAEAASAE